MSLLGTIQQSAGALSVAQIGLQVVGNNIANANTEGYIRQELQQASSVAVREGNLIKGLGVRATGIVQVIDDALAERMLAAKTDLAGAESLDKAYKQLEELVSDLDNSGLNQQLTLFNNALHELSAQPAEGAIRDFVILQGQTLADSIQTARQNAIDRQTTWNAGLPDTANQINRLTERIARLNLEIATIEGGGLVHSDATGLRDQRLRDLDELAGFVNINIQERESGSISVFVGGDYLISNGIRREVYTAYDPDAGGNEVRILETDSPLQVTGGTLAATMEARDGVFSDFVGQLDKMATTLIRGINEVHSQGQGRRGFTEIESAVSTDAFVPLENAGLGFLPTNGTFDLSVVDKEGELISTHRIPVRILGTVDDSTVSSIVSDIDQIEGITATVTSEGKIEILTDSPTARFTFGEDTSGFVAAAGLNTFFVGDSAVDISVNPTLLQNSDYLAISSGGINQDTDVLIDLVDLVDKPLDELDGRSIRGVYEETVSVLAQRINLQNSSTEGIRNFHATLQSQHLAITGVNIDEEAINMITYQRAFQASSRVIATANEMLEILVNL
tara:strand:+ start:189362 stop:191050 length:1689 start_codon:yes stop_codon:yes gene_type:complete